MRLGFGIAFDVVCYERIDIVNFAVDTRLALKEHTLVHPFPVFGTLNAYQWLIYVPLHTMRHCDQIAEVKATAGYPRDQQPGA